MKRLWKSCCDGDCLCSPHARKRHVHITVDAQELSLLEQRAAQRRNALAVLLQPGVRGAQLSVRRAHATIRRACVASRYHPLLHDPLFSVQTYHFQYIIYNFQYKIIINGTIADLHALGEKDPAQTEEDVADPHPQRQPCDCCDTKEHVWKTPVLVCNSVFFV